MRILVLIHSIVSMLICMYYYSEACFYTKADSYKEVAKKLLGRKFAVILDIAIIVSQYGFMTAYVIVSSNGIIAFFQHVAGVTFNAFIVKAVIAWVIMFPLCLLKSLKQLSKISTIAGLVIFVFVITIAVYFFIGVSNGMVLCEYQDGGQTNKISFSLPATPNTSVINAVLWFFMYIPAIHGNFSAHPVVPRFFKELIAPYALKKQLVSASIRWAILAVTVCLCVSGFLGAAMFGDSIKQNILQAFVPCKFLWINILSLMYAFVVIVNFPIVLYPLKTSLVQTCGHEIETKKGYTISIFIAAAFVVSAMLLAMFLEAIVSIFGLFAAIAGFFYYFFCPFYFFIIIKELRSQQQHLDLLPASGVHEIDNTATALLAIMTNNSIQNARRLSKIFGEKEVVLDDEQPRRMSRKLSINSNGKSRKVSIVKRGSISAQVVPNIIKDVESALKEAEVEQPQVEQPVSIENPWRKTSKGRKIGGICIIVVYGLVCLEGVVLNLIDVINTFK